MTKLPPIEKIYEAWSAIADGRVDIVDAENATVESSDHERRYTIVYDPKTQTYASDDNATFWRGYPGYPVLAVMMLRGELPLDRPATREWAGINWNALNKEYDRDYAAAVGHIESERGIDAASAARHAQTTMEAIAEAPYKTKRLIRRAK